MKQFTKITILSVALIFGGIGSNVVGQKMIKVFDGRERSLNSQELTDKDEEVFDGLIKDQEANIKANLKEESPADCKIRPRIGAVVQGSLPNRIQRRRLIFMGWVVADSQF